MPPGIAGLAKNLLPGGDPAGPVVHSRLPGSLSQLHFLFRSLAGFARTITLAL